MNRSSPTWCPCLSLSHRFLLNGSSPFWCHCLSCFSRHMDLDCSFGDVYALELLRRCLQHEVCSNCVFRNTPEGVTRRGLHVAVSFFFSFEVFGLVILKRLCSETRVYRSYFGMVTLY